MKLQNFKDRDLQESLREKDKRSSKEQNLD